MKTYPYHEIPLTYRLWETFPGARIFRVFSRNTGTKYFIARCKFREGVQRRRFYDMNDALEFVNFCQPYLSFAKPQ